MTALHEDDDIKDNQHDANANGGEYHPQEIEMEQHHHQQQLAILICSANIGNAEPTRESLGAWIPSDGEFYNNNNNLARGGDKHEMAKNNDGCCSIVDDDVDDDNNDNDDIINQRKQKKKFDIIVIGMQEAAFINISTNSSNNNNNNNNNDKSEDYEDGRKNTKNSKQSVSDDLVDTDDNDDYSKKGDSDNNIIIHDSNGENDNDERSIRECRGDGSGDDITTATGVLFDMVNDGITGLRRGGEKSSRRVIQNIGRGSLFVRGLGSISPPKTIRLPRTMMNKV